MPTLPGPEKNIVSKWAGSNYVPRVGFRVFIVA